MVARTGFPRRLGVPQGVALVAGGGSEVGARRQAGGVAQQVAQRDRAVAGRQGQPGEMRADRRVEVESPGLRQLQQRQRGHGLADAADLEGSFGERRAPRRQVGVPHAGGEKRLPPVGHRDGQAGGGRGREPALQVFDQGSEILRSARVGW